MSNKINTECGNNSTLVQISNNNVKYYEELAAQYASEAEKSVSACAVYLAAAQRCITECQNILTKIETYSSDDLNLHLEDLDNPHEVTAEQTGAYTTSEVDALITEINTELEEIGTSAEAAYAHSQLTSGNPHNVTADDIGTYTTDEIDELLANIDISGIDLTDYYTKAETDSAITEAIPVNVSEFTNDAEYVTSSELETELEAKQDTLTFDTAPTSGSTNPVTSGGIYTALSEKADTSDLATVATTGSYDDLTDVPTNVSEFTNDAEYVNSTELAAELETKQDVLTFDTTPVSGSTNPVTSGGIYTALSEKADADLEDTPFSDSGLYITNSAAIDTTEWYRAFYTDYDKTNCIWLEQGGYVEYTDDIESGASVTVSAAFTVPYYHGYYSRNASAAASGFLCSFDTPSSSDAGETLNITITNLTSSSASPNGVWWQTFSMQGLESSSDDDQGSSRPGV